jgi:DNA repair exonuclease SbcCD ATPase subunit
MTDFDDSRQRETMAPDTEPATNPEASSVPLVPRAPRAPRLSEHVRDQSIDELLRLHSVVQEHIRDLLDPDGRLAKRQDDRLERLRRDIVLELGGALESLAGQPLKRLEARLAKLAELLTSVRHEVELVRHDVEQLVPRVAGSEARITAMEREVADLRSRLEQQETLLREIRALADRLDRELHEARDAARSEAPS